MRYLLAVALIVLTVSARADQLSDAQSACTGLGVPPDPVLQQIYHDRRDRRPFAECVQQQMTQQAIKATNDKADEIAKSRGQ